MNADTREALVERLSRFEVLVEVGIGRQPAVAAALADAGKTVTATDVYDRGVPDGVSFVRDDVTVPDRTVYEGADAVYGLNLPPELHRPTRRLAESVDAAFQFTTLGSDQPAVPVERATVPGDTLYVARRADPADGE